VSLLNATLIICNPHVESFTHAIAQALCDVLSQRGVELRVHDLYTEKFDPILPLTEILRKFSFDTLVQAHMEDLSWSDLVVIAHPDWWGQPPAMLKGWIDRVLRPGVAYEFEGEEFTGKRRVPLLSGKRAAVFCTTDSFSEADCGTLRDIWCRVVWPYCGIADPLFMQLTSTRELGHAARQRWIDRCKERIVDLL
jgi:NAD(P)H dehydrogenase (quinone)